MILQEPRRHGRVGAVHPQPHGAGQDQGADDREHPGLRRGRRRVLGDAVSEQPAAAGRGQPGAGAEKREGVEERGRGGGDGEGGGGDREGEQGRHGPEGREAGGVSVSLSLSLAR